ncbi:MAG: pyrroline-5-carboxylate reductase [Chloroflexota bacterium]|nr:pyrroline-5-carboxylate reductase [Chloroflexota bacterium]
MQVAFIGGGMMAEAILKGLRAGDKVKPKNIVVSDVCSERRQLVCDNYGISVTSDNCQALKNADIVIIAVKPNVLRDVLEELSGRIQVSQLVLSIVAGATLASIRDGLGHQSIVRAMPNTPAQIGEGITVWTSTDEVSEAQKQKACSILKSLGHEYYVPEEKYVDMATAVSGSGPAYVFLVIESLIDAAVHIGLPRSMAEELVLHTMSGSTHLVQQTQKHPAELRNMVTSPGGTTAEGIQELEQGSIRALFTQAIMASYEKAKDLGRGR